MFTHKVDKKKCGEKDMMYFFIFLTAFYFFGFFVFMVVGNRMVEGIEEYTSKEANEELKLIKK